jgi:hypothetical protein
MKTSRQSGDIAVLFLTWALDGGDWSGSRLSRFLPEESPLSEAGWAPESLWILWKDINLLPVQGNEPLPQSE